MRSLGPHWCHETDRGPLDDVRPGPATKRRVPTPTMHLITPRLPVVDEHAWACIESQCGQTTYTAVGQVSSDQASGGAEGRVGGPSAVDQAHDALLAFIKAAPVGTRIPSERELVERLGVSRATLRDALGRLSYVGLIEVRHGGGAFVSDPRPERLVLPFRHVIERHAGDLGELFALREALEPELAARAALRRGPADQIALREDVRRARALVTAAPAEHGPDPESAGQGPSTGDPGLGPVPDPVLAVFDRIAEIAGSALCAEVVRAARSISSVTFTPATDANVPVGITAHGRPGPAASGATTARHGLALEQHAAIAEAVVAGDAQAARDATLVHLNTVHRWCVADRESLVGAQDGAATDVEGRRPT